MNLDYIFVSRWALGVHLFLFVVFLLKKILFRCMCIIVFCLPDCMWAGAQEKGFRCPGIGVTDGCKPSSGFWDSNSGPLQEQQVFLTAKPILQPSLCFLETVSCCGLGLGHRSLRTTSPGHVRSFWSIQVVFGTEPFTGGLLYQLEVVSTRIELHCRDS